MFVVVWGGVMLDAVYPSFPEQCAGLLVKLDSCTTLPSPPGIAEKILALAEDPSSGINDFAEVVRVDVALTARLLQLANSPVYGLSREIYDVRHAITVLGLEATLSNALSIALVSSIRDQETAGIDYRHFWRRSIASASANRLLARHVRAPVAEHYFMAGLLQDIGMIAFATLDEELYVRLGSRQKDHRAVIAEEEAVLAANHALAGAWLVNNWALPRRYAEAINGSHDPASAGFDSDNEQLVWCTAVSGSIADIIYSDNPDAGVRRALGMGGKRAQLTPAALNTVLEKLVPELNELGALFDLDLGTSEWLTTQLERGMSAVESLAGEAAPMRA